MRAPLDLVVRRTRYFLKSRCLRRIQVVEGVFFTDMPSRFANHHDEFSLVIQVVASGGEHDTRTTRVKGGNLANHLGCGFSGNERFGRFVLTAVPKIFETSRGARGSKSFTAS